MRKLGVVGGSVSVTMLLTAIGLILHGIGQENGNEVMGGLMMLAGWISPGLVDWLETYRVTKDWSKEPPEESAPVKPKRHAQAAPFIHKPRPLYPDESDGYDL